jgi:hypothetical protein
MNKVTRIVLEELRELVPSMLFFLVAFHMLSITKGLLVGGHPYTRAGATLATISAITVAKSILLIDHTALGRLFANRVLDNILWKTLVFGTVAFFFRQLEEIIPLALKHGDVGAALREMVAAVPTARFLVVHMWLFTLVLIYTVAIETVRIAGADRVKAILMGPLTEQQRHGRKGPAA